LHEAYEWRGLKACSKSGDCHFCFSRCAHLFSTFPCPMPPWC